MITLALDASTYAATVALFDGEVVVAEGAAAMRNAERETLMPAVLDVLRAAARPLSSVSRIVCGAGPGSFTSLRIAGAIAKGLAVGSNIPLLAVSSLALIVASEPARAAGRYLALLDALRGDLFAQPFALDRDGIPSPLAEVSLVPAASVAEYASRFTARPLGAGFASPASPHARGALRVLAAGSSAVPVDLARWQPDYGRLAEAQVKWESTHGRPLPVG